MPYTVDTNNYAISPILPQGLGHKPVYAMPYEPFDGIYANNTDAKYLSVGMAQFDQNEVSIKSMRHTGGQWSPQAEELPIHRVIDMTLFAAKALFDTQNGTCSVPGGVFQNQSNCISISQEPRTPAELAAFNAFLERRGQFLKDRLNALADVLADLRRRGRI